MLPVAFFCERKEGKTEHEITKARLDQSKKLGLLHDSGKMIQIHVQGWTGLAVWLDSLVSGTSPNYLLVWLAVISSAENRILRTIRYPRSACLSLGIIEGWLCSSASYWYGGSRISFGTTTNPIYFAPVLRRMNQILHFCLRGYSGNQAKPPQGHGCGYAEIYTTATLSTSMLTL